MRHDDEFMHRAIQLAKLGAGKTNPNPLVGAVLVQHGEIIGEGYHKEFGGSHAEINALQNACDGVKGSTLYVTLEPCSHHGKTPPCCEAIVKAGVSRVVCPAEDPNPLVSGKGFTYLQKHGVQTDVGLLREESFKINEIFFHFITHNTPFVIMKNAMSLDGKIATSTGKSRWISSSESRAFVHRLRHRVSAIVVGVDTVLQDNPMLTTRIEKDVLESSHPLRIILDSCGRTPLDARLFHSVDISPVIIAATPKMTGERKRHLEQAGAEVLILDTRNRLDMIHQLLDRLGSRQVDSLLVEGGATIAESFIKAGVVNQYFSFIAPIIIGGAAAPTPVGGEGFCELADALRFREVNISRLGGDIVIEAYPEARRQPCLLD